MRSERMPASWQAIAATAARLPPALSLYSAIGPVVSLTVAKASSKALGKRVFGGRRFRPVYR